MKGKWTEFVEVVSGREIVCYGAGTNAVFMLSNEHFQPFAKQIKYFIDKDLQKAGEKIKGGQWEFDICSIDKLEALASKSVVIVTITDYISIGKMLDNKKITWFPWTVISTALSFDNLINSQNDKPRMILLNTPDYMNLGDQAIALSEEIYLKQNFGEYYEFGTFACHPDALTKLQEFVNDEDIIFFQGGGNLGSLWRVCEEIFRDILKKFPKNAIIVFPQSIYYGDSEEERMYFLQSQEMYNAHKKLLICVREKRSYDFVRKMYHCDCFLLPDMVLNLNLQPLVLERQGIGVLLRHDKEQLISDGYQNVINKVVEKMQEPLRELTHHPTKVPTERADRILQILKEYASCKLIITDRLHGMIFSAITNTPCIAFDNTYHKVSDVYKTWLYENQCISFSEIISEEKLLKLAKEKIESSIHVHQPEMYEEKFNVLTKYIQCCMNGEK